MFSSLVQGSQAGGGAQYTKPRDVIVVLVVLVGVVTLAPTS